MMKILNGAVLLCLLLCFVLFAGCDTGTSGDSGAPGNPASVSAFSLDFESANIT